MNDYRAAAQELQGQVLAAARKGQQQMATTVKNMTAAAQQIRPQLANLPKPTINISALPVPAQLREKAPAFVAKLPTRLPANLQTKLPSPDQIRASAAELAGQARTVQRKVVEQVRSVTTPLAHQAAARLAQVGTTADGEITTRVSQVTVQSEKAADKAQEAVKRETAKSGSAAKAAKDSEPAKPRTRSTTTTTRKPRAKTATK